MHGTANIGRDLIGLERILAALLVLVRLAEDAAASSFPIRCAMLWGLRRANARVEGFAGRYVWSVGLPPRPFVIASDGNSPDAALSLAASLRVLASIIAEMITRLRRREFLFGRRSAAGVRPERRPRLRLACIDRSPLSFGAIPDTS